MNISTPELLTNFSAYLTGQHLSSVTTKNYLSDIRYFFDWIRTALPDLLPLPIDQQITPQTLNFFHQQLSGNQPIKTANRRLSSVRKFCQYLAEQNYTAINSANHLPNIISSPPTKPAVAGEVEIPSYHLIHEIPDFLDTRHLSVPIPLPAPTSPVVALSGLVVSEVEPVERAKTGFPKRLLLLLYTLPVIVFIITLLTFLLLTPPPQLITPLTP